jgi:hypothetical protein
MNWKLKEHHGWSNYYTYNVVLHITNNYELYNAAKVWSRDYPGAKEDLYHTFIKFMGLKNHKTDDDISWLDERINLKELNKFMMELI